MALSVLAVLAAGCHFYNFHVTSLHSASVDEQYCRSVIEHSSAPNADYTSIGIWLQDALVTHQPYEETYESVTHIDFRDLGECPTGPNDLAEIEIQFFVMSDIFAFCDFRLPAACVQETNCNLDPSTNHRNCDAFKVYMNIASVFNLDPYGPDTLDDHREAFINHETGHVFGLDDVRCGGDEDQPDCPLIATSTDGSTCYVNLPGDPFWVSRPVESIMHYDVVCCRDLVQHVLDDTSCVDHWPPGNLTYPSAWDLAMIENIAKESPLIEY